MDAAAANPSNGLPDEVKRQLKSIVLELRHVFEDDLSVGLKRFGIDVAKGAVADAASLSHLTHDERDVRRVLDAVLAKEAAMTKDVPEAIRAVRREAAYTHLNRLIGLKCLELRGHLAIDVERTEVVTPRREYADLPKYLWTLRARDASLLGDPEALWRRGLQRAFEVTSAELGVLFDPGDPYAQVWPSYNALMRAVETLSELPESAFRADELLGWVYQYFQSEEKDRVFEEVRTKKKKIAWADIVPVTQLYTERYMVDFLLHNSLGARWMEMYPDSKAKEAWPYYVEPATPYSREPQPVKEWTVLDPCCGSGHFLVVAFDLLVQLYAEERALAERGVVPTDWAVPEEDVPRTILERNLHGIDIDPRAVQLSALALYLKAKEHGLAGTPAMNLAIADCVLQRGEHFQALLAHYKDDPEATEAIEAIWSALEHVRELGSLVGIEEEVVETVSRARTRADGSFADLDADWGAYKAGLLERLRDALAAENLSLDERRRVFRGEATKGLSLLELLSSRYDVVCTNPPYMGSGNMARLLRQYVEERYRPFKHDLYLAFIARCADLAARSGSVAMVTRRAWLFAIRQSDARARLLERRMIATLADLGSGAFEQGLHDNVTSVLFVLGPDDDGHQTGRVVAVRDSYGPSRKCKDLLRRIRKSMFFTVDATALRGLPGRPFIYDLPRSLLAAMGDSGRVLNAVAEIVVGLQVRSEEALVRCWWEVADHVAWRPYSKGGGFCRWYGLDHFVVYWAENGQVHRNNGRSLPGERWYESPGLTYSDAAYGDFGARVLPAKAVIGNAGPGIFLRPHSSETSLEDLLGILNSRLTVYVLRKICPGHHVRGSYLGRVPLLGRSVLRSNLVKSLLTIVRHGATLDLVSRLGVLDELLTPSDPLAGQPVRLQLQMTQLLHEAANDLMAFDDTQELVALREAVDRSVGRPAGAERLLAGYDARTMAGDDVPLPQAVHSMLDNLTTESLSAADLDALRAALRSACTGSIADDSQRSQVAAPDEGDSEMARSLPAMNWLERTSLSLSVNPLTVFWLLEELRRDTGVVCAPEVTDQAADWVSVKLLRMLGHRWPMQDHYEEERGKPFLDPAWIDADGILTLTPGMGEEPLPERFRRFLDSEFGSDQGHEVERELTHALGWKPGVEWGKQKPLSLARWFEREFFKRHVTQFKRRPIAWHLRSAKGTVNVIVYYHKFNRDRLALLRARYVGNLRRELAGELEAVRRQGLDDPANLTRIEKLEERLADLDAFDAKLAELQEGRTRGARIWCPWKEPDEQPRGWDPDINDGVRVNIAPVQRLGLLAAGVLSAKDLESLLAPEGRG